MNHLRPPALTAARSMLADLACKGHQEALTVAYVEGAALCASAMEGVAFMANLARNIAAALAWGGADHNARSLLEGITYRSNNAARPRRDSRADKIYFELEHELEIVIHRDDEGEPIRRIETSHVLNVEREAWTDVLGLLARHGLDLTWGADLLLTLKAWIEPGCRASRYSPGEPDWPTDIRVEYEGEELPFRLYSRLFGGPTSWNRVEDVIMDGWENRARGGGWGVWA